jgi:hypothetical protein
MERDRKGKKIVLAFTTGNTQRKELLGFCALSGENSPMSLDRLSRVSQDGGR